MAGPMALGHHVMVRFPDHEGSGVVSTSRFVHGQVYPGEFEPDEGGYQALEPGAEFESLDRVPLADGGFTDLSRYPARPRVRGPGDGGGRRHVAVRLDRSHLRRRGLRLVRAARPAGPAQHRASGSRTVAGTTRPGTAGTSTSSASRTSPAYFHDGRGRVGRRTTRSAERGHPTAVELDPERPLAVNHSWASPRSRPASTRSPSIEPGTGAGDGGPAATQRPVGHCRSRPGLPVTASAEG